MASPASASEIVPERGSRRIASASFIIKVGTIKVGTINIGNYSREGDRVNVKSHRSAGWLILIVFVITSSLIAQQAAKSPGAAIFQQKCILCHGADGHGKTPLGKQLQAADLSSPDVQRQPDAELRRIIHDGQGNMPSFADQLGDAEIDQVLKQVRAFGKTAPKK